MDFRLYLRMLNRQRWVILASGLICAIAAGVFATVQSPVYTASTTLLIRPNDPGETLGDATVLPDADIGRYVAGQAAVVHSIPVAQAVARNLPKSFGTDKPTAKDLLEDVMVAGSETSNILQVLARGSSPERSRDLADAFAKQYLANRKAYDQGRLQDAVDALQGKVNTLSATIDRLTAAGAGSPGASAAPRAALASATAQYTDLLGQQQDLQVEIALKHGGAEIVSPAELPTDPSSPKRMRDVLIGLFVGLVIGVVIALIREQMNSRVSSPEEAEQLTALPLLGEIPIDAASRSRESHLFMRDQATSAAAESMRSLRTAIQLRNTRFREEPASVAWIVVTSPGQAEGKTVVAANLAASFAEAGQRTLLVSADLRNPRIERMFKLPAPNVGLGDYIQGDIPLDAAVASTDVNGLWVLRSGTPVQNPAGVFISERFDDLLQGITDAGRVEVVVFDTPPVLAVAEASELAVRADEVLLVVAEDETSRRAAQRARAVLDGVGGDAALGLVVNKVPVSSSLFDSYFRPVPR